MHKKNVCYALYFTAIYRGVYRISFSPGVDFILRGGDKKYFDHRQRKFCFRPPSKKNLPLGHKRQKRDRTSYYY